MDTKCSSGADNHDEDDDISIPILDNDTLVCEILSRLPVKSLVRFKCVCKSWLSLVEQDPRFINLHLNRSKTRPVILISRIEKNDFNSIYFYSTDLFEGGAAAVHRTTLSWYEPTLVPMLAPVNGLICFYSTISYAVLIYNLSTREQTPWIRTTLKDVGYPQPYPSYGFGFDPATKKHKVVCVWDRYWKKENNVCEVLTVGENSWRRIDEVPPFVNNDRCCHANGAIYWFTDQCRYSNDDSKFIVVFDIGSENFRFISTPNFIFNYPQFTHHMDLSLLEVDGCIAVLDGKTISRENNINSKGVRMWIFDKTSIGNWIEETISMSFDLDGEGIISFHAVAGTDLIIVRSEKHLDKKYIPFLYYYDRKKKTSKKVIINTKQDHSHPTYFYVSVFMESLLPVRKVAVAQSTPSTSRRNI